jgi:hypothetical protein
MKLYKIESLCEGDWVTRSVWARDFRYLLSLISDKPKEILNCLRIRRVASEQEALKILATDGMTNTPVDIDKLEWITT